MKGPWERYQSSEPSQEGPWTRYQSIESIEDNRHPITKLAAGDTTAIKNFGKGFVRGIKDPIDATNYTFSFGDRARRVSKENDASEAQYQAETPGSFAAGAGRFVGNVVPFSAAARALNAISLIPRSPAILRAAASSIGETFSPKVAAVAKGAPIKQKLKSYIGKPALEGALFSEAINNKTDNHDIINSMLFGAFGGVGGQALSKGLGAGGPRPLTELDKKNIDFINAGYTIPPSSGRNPFIGSLLEKMIGKNELANKAILKNIEVTNALARKGIGLPADKANNVIMPADIAAAEQGPAAVYNAIRNIDHPISLNDGFNVTRKKMQAEYLAKVQNTPSARDSYIETVLFKDLPKNKKYSSSELLDLIRGYRFKSNLNYKSLDPSKRYAAEQEKAMANSIENLIDTSVSKSSPSAVKDLRKARADFAKIFSLEKALNETTGNVDASNLARQYAKGVPMTGELKTIAEFGRSHPKYVLPNMAAHSAVNIDNLAGLGAGGLGLYNNGIIGGLKGAMLAAARPSARSIVTSPWFQKSFVRPKDKYNLFSKIKGGLAEEFLGNGRGGLLYTEE